MSGGERSDCRARTIWKSARTAHANNYMIHNDIVSRTDIILQISELLAIISSKDNYSRNSRCPIRSQRLRRETLEPVLSGARTAPTLETASAEPVSDSELAPQPIEKAGFGLANCEPLLPDKRPGEGHFASSTAQLRRPPGSALWPTWISNRPGSSTGSKFGPTNDRSLTGSRQVTSVRSPAARTAFCTPLSSNKRPGDARHGVACEQKQGRLTGERALIVNRKRHLDRVFRLHLGRLAAKIA